MSKTIRHLIRQAKSNGFKMNNSFHFNTIMDFSMDYPNYGKENVRHITNLKKLTGYDIYSHGDYVSDGCYDYDKRRYEFKDGFASDEYLDWIRQIMKELIRVKYYYKILLNKQYNSFKFRNRYNIYSSWEESVYNKTMIRILKEMQQETLRTDENILAQASDIQRMFALDINAQTRKSLEILSKVRTK